MHSFLFLPSSKWVLVCDVLHFRTHQPAPPSSSSPASESLFTMCCRCPTDLSSSPLVSESSVMCHVSRLMNTLFPLSPLQQVILVCDVPCFQAHERAHPSSSPSVSESSFVTCHVSKLTNALLPFPSLHSVIPCL